MRPAWTLALPQQEVYGQNLKLAYSDGVLFCLTNAGPVPFQEATLYAVDGGAGKVLWSRPVRTKGLNDSLSPMLQAHGGVVFYQTEAGALRALDARTGEERWQVSDVPRTLAAAEGKVHVFDGEWLYAVLDARTGGRLETTTVRGNVLSKLEVAGGRRYFFNRDILAALDAHDGRELWTYRPDAAGSFNMRFADGILYAVTGGHLRAFDGETGRQLWLTPYEGAAPPVERGTVYVGQHGGGEPGRVVRLDAKTGRELGALNAGLQLASDNALDIKNGVLYSLTFRPHYTFDGLARTVYGDDRAGSYDYGVEALGANDGRRLWRAETVWGEYTTGLTTADDSVYLGVSNHDFGGSALLICYRQAGAAIP